MTNLENKRNEIIKNLINYYPIPNMFLGLSVKESIKHRTSLVNDIKNWDAKKVSYEYSAIK